MINALIPKKENEDFKNTFDNMLSDKSNENIIKAGTNGKILKLSLEGVIADDGKIIFKITQIATACLLNLLIGLFQMMRLGVYIFL